MVDRYRIDLPQLAKAMEAMQTFDLRAESIIAEVDRRVAALHLEAWSGAAADAQHGFHDRWMGDANQMRDSLNDLRAAGQRAHHNYHGAHAVNGDMWDQLS